MVVILERLQSLDETFQHEYENRYLDSLVLVLIHFLFGAVENPGRRRKQRAHIHCGEPPRDGASDRCAFTLGSEGYHYGASFNEADATTCLCLVYVQTTMVASL